MTVGALLLSIVIPCCDNLLNIYRSTTAKHPECDPQEYNCVSGHKTTYISYQFICLIAKVCFLVGKMIFLCYLIYSIPKRAEGILFWVGYCVEAKNPLKEALANYHVLLGLGLMFGSLVLEGWAYATFNSRDVVNYS